tara:strand:- start:638 stop:1495 length:858 start_codon:yes stop_codon:yes gene_type:complete
MNKILGLKKYFTFIKFSHTVFAMPFAIIGFFLGLENNFDWIIFIYVILCMVFARSAAMGFNRYIDRDIDSENPRTSKIREIPNGSISPKAAIIFVITNCLLFIATSYLINFTCFKLSPIALFIILGYSYTKRFTSLCHLFLGLALSLAPIGAYIAIKDGIDIVPILFGICVLFWVSGFDIIYSLQDLVFDKSKKLYSIPVEIGKKTALKISRIFHVLSIISLIIVGGIAKFNFFYWIGFFIFSSLLFYQHTLVKEDDLSKVNIAFFTTNGFASIIFGIFVVISIL